MEAEGMVSMTHTQGIMSEEFKAERQREREEERPRIYALEGFYKALSPINWTGHYNSN